MLRIELRLETDTYTSYESDPLPQSPIGSECIGMKDKISHPTLNRLYIIMQKGHRIQVGPWSSLSCDMCR